MIALLGGGLTLVAFSALVALGFALLDVALHAPTVVILVAGWVAWAAWTRRRPKPMSDSMGPIGAGVSHTMRHALLGWREIGGAPEYEGGETDPAEIFFWFFPGGGHPTDADVPWPSGPDFGDPEWDAMLELFTMKQETSVGPRIWYSVELGDLWHADPQEARRYAKGGVQ